MKNTVNVVIVICELNSGWCYYDDIVVSYCSDRKIPRGTKCSYALSKLLSNGYKLIDTQTVQSCGQIIYTLSKSKTSCSQKPEPCHSCENTDTTKTSDACNC